MEIKKPRVRRAAKPATPSSAVGTPTAGLGPTAVPALNTDRPMLAEEKRALIRVAAYRCFSEGGYHNTTVDKICESLNISKGSFYWYYSGKQAVFTAILDDWAETVEREMEAQFGNAMQGPDAYLATTAALEKEVRRGRHIMYIWLEFLSQAGRLPYVREGLASFHTRIRAVILRVLTPIFPADLSAGDREALATVILASFIGLVSQELIDPTTAGANEIIKSFMTTLRSLVGAHAGKTAGPATHSP
jgi:AcrR family transcriptional regulator